MPCQPPKTNADKLWPYQEYYHGERDEDKKKHGYGTNHWSGAESLDWYKGRMLRDTMHQYGDYRCRYLGPNHVDVTYEGRFYNNRMHGYGAMSYADGRVYNGLYYKNIRWGPGVVSHACLREDVGLWYGTQLVRLAWRPTTPSVAIDLASLPNGRASVTPHRIRLISNTKTIGDVNSALELLKQHGSEPLAAVDKWTKLYPKSCTDTASQLCHVELFDRAYYDSQINTLVEDTGNISDSSDDTGADRKTYYAWNNNKMVIHMMKHCYQHEEQRAKTGVRIEEILSGSRNSFKPAAKHELDCRTSLMASYLGHIGNVAQLINEADVNPNVTDTQGNSVLMYAACGDQPELIHFLLEAGAEIDGYNDACCTPLGVTLLRFALARWDIAPGSALQAILTTSPPQHGTAPAHPPTEEPVNEWHIKRDLSAPVATNVLSKSPSKIIKPGIKRIASLTAVGSSKTKKSEPGSKNEEVISASLLSFYEEKRLYNSINNEYMIKVNEAYSLPSGTSSTPCIFEVHDMTKDVDLDMSVEDDHKRVAEKIPKKNASKLIKNNLRPSREMMWQSIDLEDSALDSKELMKQDKMGRIMLTILQLLADGADPRKARCPHPPLLIATVAGCADLVRQLLRHGADVNEMYPKALGYSTLDIAVSGPLTFDNLEVIRALLECGAQANHRIPVQEPVTSGPLVPEVNLEGPTLLHAVLARKPEFEPEEEIRRQTLELLLRYGCDPITQYKGRSSVDVAMKKNTDIFDIFIRSPHTDLNAIINDSNQSILLKMFYLPYSKSIPLTEKIQTLTNLLLFGADPLVKCQNGKDEYENLFVFAKKVLADLEAVRRPPSPTSNPKKAKSEMKTKKVVDKKDTKSTKSIGQGSKSQAKANTDDFADYKQALELVVECARLLYIRWLQAKLMNELIEIVDRYKHRQWNMIIKEHKNKKSTGLWLSVVRCLEIWDVLKTTKKKVYNDRVLKLVLCIVHYYYKLQWKILRAPLKMFYRNVPIKITAPEKALIESEVTSYIQEHKLATMSTPDVVPAIRPYVTPELTVTGIEKFNVCFECALPLKEGIPCGSCKLISFCSFACMKRNIGRINCHPCSEYLKVKYFPTPEETETDPEVNV